MGTRGFLGGILGFGTGFYVRYMLSASGPDFPTNYAWLYATAAVFQTATLLAFAAVPEPVIKVRKKRANFREHLAQGVSILKTDRDYMLLFVIRVLSSVGRIGSMVFIPYAIKSLSMPESFVGILIIISTCFALPSNFVWSHIGDRYGNRLLLLISTFMYLSVPIIATLSYYLPSYNFPLLGLYDLRVVVFIIAFTISAISMKGRGMGFMNYILELSPEERRPSYLAFMSVLLAPTVLVPLVGGIIAELISFQATFMLSLVFGLGAYILMFRMSEPRDRYEEECDEGAVMKTAKDRTRIPA
jgi:Na+/melibiose symporter-like transporter